MTQSGYIPFPRAFFDEPTWHEDRTFTKAEAVIDLYQRAAYAPRRQYVDGKLIELQPGQVVASLRYLGEAWGWSKNKVAKFLDENRDSLSTELRTGITVITISFLSTYYGELPNNGTAKGHARDSEGTAKGQQKDKIEESNKETKKEGKVGATPAPLFEVGSSTVGSAQSATLPGSSEFDLLKRIGKPAAQIWTQSNAAALFTTPNHADLALQWMEYRTSKAKPYTSHNELKALIDQFGKYNTADLLTMMNYSMTAGYTALYPDQIEKQKKKNQPQQRLNLDPNDLNTTRQNVQTTASGLKLVK
jgi:hypothetical protein